MRSRERVPNERHRHSLKPPTAPLDHAAIVAIMFGIMLSMFHLAQQQTIVVGGKGRCTINAKSFCRLLFLCTCQFDKFPFACVAIGLCYRCLYCRATHKNRRC